jgi:hypothetical protein
MQIFIANTHESSNNTRGQKINPFHIHTLLLQRPLLEEEGLARKTTSGSQLQALAHAMQQREEPFGAI